ncbi:TetR/AcrR family transcriptional regulator [Rhizobium sp. PP-CC-3G-465]|uniref:TetR/AcrR family transcriptional regulator n=1 Tax=Rhizobium sp. PP-CC-3G-465 TaxID=2135648 RepID=UPI00104EBEA3
MILGSECDSHHIPDDDGALWMVKPATLRKSEVTRRNILAEASASLRRLGLERLSVASLMGSLNLTHGGFYAHFKSKDDLAAEAVTYAFDEISAAMVKATEGRSPREALIAAIDQYASLESRNCVEKSCPSTSLANDAPRFPSLARERFAEGLERFPARIERLLREIGHEDPRRAARSAVSELLGAMIVARATLDTDSASDILLVSRDAVKKRLGLL